MIKKYLLTISVFLTGTLIASAQETHAPPQPPPSMFETAPELTFVAEDVAGSGQDYDIAFSTPRAGCKQLLDKAERLYREAVRLYEEGKTGRAKECFNTAIETLQHADNDAHVYYQMKSEMDNLFRGLRWLVPEHTGADNSFENQEYTIPMAVENKLVEKYMTIFSHGKPSITIRRALAVSGKYRKMILTILNEYDLPRELVYLPIIESLYNVNDCSSKGAVGLWQLMPERARALGLKVNYWIDERKDPEKSTIAAARYLKYLHIMFDDWHLALAAYNRGEFGLVRDIEAARAVTINQISNRKATPDETEYFVPQFIACTLICDEAFSSGNAPALEEPETFDEVILNDIVDIGIIATCAGTNSWRIRQLNPALKSWCTPPNYPGFKLRIPHGTKKKFLSALAAVPDRNPSPGYIKYVVGKGERVNDIAKKFQTSVWSIKKANRLVNIKNIKTGETLMVRPGKDYFTR